MSTKIDAPADDITLRYILREGSTLYVLNANGTNLWSAHVQPGHTDGGQRFPDAECERIAAILADRASTSRAGGWISVADRLPPKHIEVLVAFGGISIPSTGQYTDHPGDRKGWCYPSENRGCCDDHSDPVVTHWMPLPAAPGQAALPAAVDVGAAQAETAQAALVVPAGWSLTHAERGYSLRSPSGEEWLFQPSTGTGTPSHFTYEFLAAMAAATSTGATHGKA